MDAPSNTAARLSLEELSCTFDEVTAVDDLSLDIAAGEIVCLLGPSGCGKSTTLRLAAGVERQDRGRVLLEGKVVSDAAIHHPPEGRSIGLIFQDFALFPHLSVGQNVAFGLDRRSRDRDGVVKDYLDRVGLSGFAGKYPHMLSGGEQQRVALARALAPRPGVMLMDEPFSGLDNRLRDDVRDEALSILKNEGAAVLLVTHEPDEAMRMADRIALMRAGRIVQIGAPYQIYTAPVDRGAAGFFSDINVISGVVRNNGVDTPFGPFEAPGLSEGSGVEVVVRPQHLVIEVGDAPADAQNGAAASGVVARARFMGAQSLIEVQMDHDGSFLRATVPHAFLPERGAKAWLSIDRDRCFVFPAER
ncbi:MAG: ABC transporter ATP-binding protein [Pseudomonadota bacterium]